MSNEKKIREACIKANPEIVELKFGCYVKFINPRLRVKWVRLLTHQGGGEYRILIRIDTSQNIKEYQKDYGHCSYDSINEKDIKIIGRPIQLSDVLIAVDDASKATTTEDLGIDMLGVYDKWNLKESLENQSDETKKFIAELL